jgi:Lamin Tail Domain
MSSRFSPRRRTSRNWSGAAADNPPMPAAWSLPACVLLVAGCPLDTRLADEQLPDAGLPARAAAPPGPDLQGPRLGPLDLMPLADCLRLRLESDEPATATATFRAGEAVEEKLLGTGATLFDLPIRLERLPVGALATVTVAAQDTEGNLSGPSAPTELVVPPSRSPLAITELMVNPAGDEASQEYVEIRNLGAQTIHLEGLRLADDAGSDELPAVDLAPGANALVVPGSFAVDPAGPMPLPGAPLLRAAGRLGRDGLRQSGEVVRLLDGQGVILSSYGGWIDTSAPAWQGRSVQRLPDPDACDHPRAWSESPHLPTPGW